MNPRFQAIAGGARRPGRINPDGGEPEVGAPDVGELHPPRCRHDEPFPPDPAAQAGTPDRGGAFSWGQPKRNG